MKKPKTIKLSSVHTSRQYGITSLEFDPFGDAIKIRDSTPPHTHSIVFLFEIFKKFEPSQNLSKSN